MKRVLSLLLFLFTINNLFAQAELSFETQAFLNSVQPENKQFKVMVILSDKVDLWGMRANFVEQNVPAKLRAKQVILALQNKATETQSVLLEILGNEFELGKDFTVNEQFWALNGIEFTAKKPVVEYLSNSSLVASLLNPDEVKYILHKPVEESSGDQGYTKTPGTPEPGLIAVGAHHLWAMGYTGHGTMLYCIDTGVWQEHPAIGDRFLAKYKPLAQTWYAYDSPVPIDKSGNHGTHVIGTVLGLEEATADTIGVAFKATYIASDPVATSTATAKNLSENVAGFQWALNPDGDVETTDDIPDVINNSWGKPQTGPTIDIDPCANSAITDVLDAVFVAGIGNIFSAGNSGPGDMTLGQPGNYAGHPLNLFTVGAVTGTTPSFPIASFSSRGPTFCASEFATDTIKPEVVAPGVSVRSADGQSGYGLKSGTSMASPHVSGVFLLLKEAFPMLSGEDIMNAIYQSANDLGVEGEDNTFGRGMINALDAFNYLAENNTPVEPAVKEFDAKMKIYPPSQSFVCSNSEGLPLIEFTNDWEQAHTAALGASFEVKINGVLVSTIPFTETVQPNETYSFSFDFTPFSENIQAGFNELSVSYVRDLPEPIDYNSYNNTYFWRFSGKEMVNLPFVENFENSADFNQGRWTVLNPDVSTTWELVETTGLEESEQSVYIRLSSYLPASNQIDGLISPEINLGDALEKTLSFNYAHNWRGSSSFADTLVVSISENCGVSYQEVFRKGGSELDTVEGSSANFLPSEPAHWTEQFISLDQFSGSIIIKFESINRRGNNLVLDNINVYEGPTPVSINDLSLQNVYGLFPNPTKNKATISWKVSQVQPETVEVFDMLGSLKAIYNIEKNNSQFTFTTENFSNGIYLIRVCSTENCNTLKLFKN